MSKSPKKRLVHKHQYVKMVGKKSALYSSASAMGVAGVVLLLVAALLSWFSFAGWRNDLTGLGLILLNGGIAATGIGMIWAATTLFTNAQQIEPGIPITKSNLQQLTASESLVRASDAPLTQQASELLRAARYGKATAPNQLLRAAQEHRAQEHRADV